MFMEAHEVKDRRATVASMLRRRFVVYMIVDFVVAIYLINNDSWKMTERAD